MHPVNLIYSALLLLTLAYPFFRFNEQRLRIKRNFKFLVLSILVIAVFFIAWDIVFTRQGVWSFNRSYVFGVFFFRLPVEEWLFFMVIPYSCFFVYEVVVYFFPHPPGHRWIVTTGLCLAFVWMLIVVIHFSKLYTAVSFVLSSAVLIIVSLMPAYRQHLWHFWVSYFFCLLPFFLVNGILTALPVVIYSSSAILNVRFLTIPVEDFVYCHALLFSNFMLYNHLIRKHGR